MCALMTIYYKSTRQKHIKLLLFAQILAVMKKFCVLTRERWVQDEWARCIARMKYILGILGHSIA